jgi:hypothetical protein
MGSGWSVFRDRNDSVLSLAPCDFNHKETPMTEAIIRRLRNRYGLTDTHARLIATLYYGGKT